MPRRHSRAIENREVLPPRAHCTAVLFGHDSSDLSQVGQVITNSAESVPLIGPLLKEGRQGMTAGAQRLASSRKSQMCCGGK